MAKQYPIYIGQHLLGKSDTITPHIIGKEVVIITNPLLKSLYGPTVESALTQHQVDWIEVPDGEQYKTLETLQSIFDRLLQKAYDRTVTLIALGGGVVGDMVGFAAATYLRGVPYIQIPTTLLAQVDAAIGGKTAVNHALGKNMIGAFYHPQCVIADIGTLETLDDRQFKAGFAEVIKYGLLGDKIFFEWIEKNLELVLQKQPEQVIEAIKRSCEHKVKIISVDERDEGQRLLLNLGHTFAHAIEAATNFNEWLHGEAVAVGMLIAAECSKRLGHLGEKDVTRIRKLLVKTGLPTTLPKTITPGSLLSFMQRDKKVAHRQLRLVILKSIGEAFVTEEVSTDFLTEVLDDFAKS